jgi:sugar/nucleoside kinase (ribokinase family)
MKRDFAVMVAGHLCLDLIPALPDSGERNIARILTPGKLVDVGPCTLATGGAVSNTGIAMRKLGAAVAFCARIGEDGFGRLVHDAMARHGDIAGIHAAAGSDTSYSVVVAPPGIDRIFLHHPGANDEFGAADLDPALLARCRHFHFGYPPLMAATFADEGAELERIFRLAKAAGATTSLDMALPDPASPAGRAPWHRILTRVLPLVDIFLPSLEEAFYMLDPERFLRLKREHGGAELMNVLPPTDYSRLADQILAMGPCMTTLKAGERGWYFRSGRADSFGPVADVLGETADDWADRELWSPTWQVGRVVSATGAGDASIAGFLRAFLAGMPVAPALRAASCLGWQNVQALDALGGIRDWPETLRLLADDPPTLDPRLADHGWHRDPALRLWRAPQDGQAR